jgi:hypothetical protein
MKTSSVSRLVRFTPGERPRYPAERRLDGLEVLMEVGTNTVVFWGVTPFSLVGDPAAAVFRVAECLTYSNDLIVMPQVYDRVTCI